MTPEQAYKQIVSASVPACTKINRFSATVLRTRGGRIGSGMGGLLEALWGYFTNTQLRSSEYKEICELAWMYGHEYHDFACVCKDEIWDPDTRKGELLRVECKSMVASADEPKAHFDEISKKLNEHDLLVILVWDWKKIDGEIVSPQIVDHFVAPALPIAKLRDVLHLARGGSFVLEEDCPDKCLRGKCTHVGEPLNEQGSRERITGPVSCKPKASGFGANFGGMVRMLKTSSKEARTAFRQIVMNNEVARAYAAFIYKNFPNEEVNHFSSSEWKTLAATLKCDDSPSSKDELITRIRSEFPNYRYELYKLFWPTQPKPTKHAQIVSTAIPTMEHR